MGLQCSIRSRDSVLKLFLDKLADAVSKQFFFCFLSVLKQVLRRLVSCKSLLRASRPFSPFKFLEMNLRALGLPKLLHVLRHAISQKITIPWPLSTVIYKTYFVTRVN